MPAVAEFTIQLGTTGKEKVCVNLIGILGYQILEAQKRNSSHPSTVFPFIDFSMPLQVTTNKFSKVASSS